MNSTTAYAALLATGLAQLRLLEATPGISKKAIRNFETSVSYNIRWFSIGDRVFDASKAAMNFFAGRVDLHQLKYDDQLRAERTIAPGLKKRSILKLEHKTCVADIWKEIKASDGSIEAIERILKTIQIVWILVEEDNRLQRSGRGSNHDAIYEAAGIQVVRNPVTV